MALTPLRVAVAHDHSVHCQAGSGDRAYYDRWHVTFLVPEDPEPFGYHADTPEALLALVTAYCQRDTSEPAPVCEVNNCGGTVVEDHLCAACLAIRARFDSKAEGPEWDEDGRSHADTERAP